MQRRAIYHAVAFFFLLMGVTQHRSRMNLYNRENIDVLQKHLINKSCKRLIDDTQYLNIMMILHSICYSVVCITGHD